MRAILAAVLLAAACVGVASCSGFDYCDHRGWVKGTVIQTHSWPVPDITAAEVRSHADYTTFGLSPSCTDVGVQGMRRSGNPDFWGRCYANSTQNGTRIDRCEGELHSVRDWWNASDVDGYFTSSGGRRWSVWSTIYSEADRVVFSGSCSIHGDGIPSGARFVCTYHRDF